MIRTRAVAYATLAAVGAGTTACASSTDLIKVTTDSDVCESPGVKLVTYRVSLAADAKPPVTYHFSAVNNKTGQDLASGDRVISVQGATTDIVRADKPVTVSFTDSTGKKLSFSIDDPATACPEPTATTTA